MSSTFEPTSLEATGPAATGPAATAPARVGDWRTSWRRLGANIRSINPSQAIRIVLVILALVVLAWLLWFTWAALLPFQLGVVASYLMLPLVNKLEQWMPRWAAVVIVFVGGLLGLIGILGYLVPPLANQITQLLSSLPSTDEIRSQLSAWFTDLETYVQTLPPDVQNFINDGITRALTAIRDNIVGYGQTLASFLLNTVMSVANTFGFLLGFLIIPFWLVYVLIDQKKGLEALNNLLPSWMRADFWALLRIPDRAFSGFLRGQLFLGSVVAGASFAGLTLLRLAGVEGIRFELLLAVFAGVMELVPYVGPLIGAVPAIGVGFLHSPETALAIALLYLIIQQLESNLLIPRVLGQSVDIHPAILTALLVALTQLGFLWFLLAAPLAATIRDLYRYIYGRVSDPPLPAGVLPGETPPEPEPIPERAPEQQIA